jgi:hypothetical protein
MGLEVYGQICQRFALPIGTRSISYLTRLLKPTFDNNNFEESFPTWEFELARYERDNNTQLPDAVKIAVLMNETTGALQQHLQLNAGQAPTYNEVRETMEYYRTTIAFSRLRAQTSSAIGSNYGGGTAPMDISATYKGKNKGQGKGKGKQGKGYKGYKGKGQHKGKKSIYNNYGYGGYNKGKGKHPTNVYYRCGQPGHLAKEC